MCSLPVGGELLGLRRKATGQPHIHRQPGFFAIPVVTDNGASGLADGKRPYRRGGFEILVWNLVEADAVDELACLNEELPARRIEPYSFSDQLIPGNIHVHLTH